METKLCKICDRVKFKDDFYKHKRASDGLQDRCKDCTNNARKARSNRNRRFVARYLKTKCCTDCGNGDSRVLEFDHIRGKKESNVSVLVNYGYSIKKIKEEIRKCEIRCANCHRIRHYEEGY